MKIKLDKWAHMPERAHETDAGLDLKAMNNGVLYPHDCMTFDTGVHVEIPEGCCGLLVSKSGLNCNYGITSTGLIDQGYTGSIRVKLYNHSDDQKIIRAGEKISQLVIIPVRYEPIEVVEEISGGDRGNNGFGSTGM